MTGILFIFMIIINIIGVAHEVVSNVNNVVGLHLNGFLMFFIAWAIAVMIDALFSSN
jgi:hypothetical protein